MIQRLKGVEPSSRAWEARVMPLYDSRIGEDEYTPIEEFFQPVLPICRDEPPNDPEPYLRTPSVEHQIPGKITLLVHPRTQDQLT